MQAVELKFIDYEDRSILELQKFSLWFNREITAHEAYGFVDEHCSRDLESFPSAGPLRILENSGETAGQTFSEFIIDPKKSIATSKPCEQYQGFVWEKYDGISAQTVFSIANILSPSQKWEMTCYPNNTVTEPTPQELRNIFVTIFARLAVAIKT